VAQIQEVGGHAVDQRIEIDRPRPFLPSPRGWMPGRRWYVLGKSFNTKPCAVQPELHELWMSRN